MDFFHCVATGRLPLNFDWKGSWRRTHSRRVSRTIEKLYRSASAFPTFHALEHFLQHQFRPLLVCENLLQHISVPVDGRAQFLRKKRTTSHSTIVFKGAGGGWR